MKRGKFFKPTAMVFLAAAMAAKAEIIPIPASLPVLHPRIVNTETNVEALRARLQDSVADMKQRVDAYVDRCQTNSDWMTSRLQMYWQSHATEVFIKGDFFDHAGGEAAPVPTVRFPGARDSTSIYGMPELEDVPPYSEDPRGVLLVNRSKPGRPLEWAEPSKSGRAIESINTRIMGLASTAAQVYWITGDEKYARFAGGLFDTYMTGMYYQKAPNDLNHGHNQHIAGLSSFEVIQEGVLDALAATYDYLHDYLKTNSPEKIPLYTATFKKWADIQITNGVPFNNWDLIQARHVLNIALVLENNGEYADGKGAQYYLDQVLNQNCAGQWSLTRLLERGFDPDTGMWYECPGYAMNVVVGGFAGLVTFFDDNVGIDFLAREPVIGKAVLATAQYLFPNGYVVGWGDSHYVRLNSSGAARQLVANARKHNRPEQEELFTRFIKTLDAFSGTTGGGRRGREGGRFARGEEVTLSDSIPAGRIEDFVSPTFNAASVSWFVQRNGMDPQTGLMISENGSKGNHMHANGIAMELYGKGLVLAPASGIGTSYFQTDYAEYYSQFPANNTVVVDGISSYPVMRSHHGFEVRSCYPASGVKQGIFAPITFSDVYFLEPETDADQDRLMSIIRTGEATGYYVDIFRSRRKNGADKKHDYFYHNLGQNVTLAGAGGRALNLQPTDKLAFADGDLDAYDYLYDKKSVAFTNDFNATFTLKIPDRDDVMMNLWMKGCPDREIFSVKSPPSKAFGRGMIPDDIASLPLPTIVVQQHGEAWTRPFVAVYEPSTAGEPKSIASITPFAPAAAPAGFAGVTVRGRAGDTQRIFSSPDCGAEVVQDGLAFRGTYAVIGETNGALQYLFLGSGRKIANPDFGIVAETDHASAALARDGQGWSFTASEPVTLKISRALIPDRDLKFGGKNVRGREVTENGRKFVAFNLPATALTPISWRAK